LFNKVTTDEVLARALHRYALLVLKDRDGSDLETLAVFDPANRAVIGEVYGDKPTTVSYTHELLVNMSEHEPWSLIAVHNHPYSTFPSPMDYETQWKTRAAYGLVFAHNGSVYKYHVGATKIRAEMIEAAVVKYLRRGYDYQTAYERALFDLYHVGVGIEVFHVTGREDLFI
jgi:hypothetical protein